MAVELFKSSQITQTSPLKASFEDYAKLRHSYFDVPAATVIGDALTTADLVTLPPGRVRVVPHLCRLWSPVAFGASRVLDVGYRAFTTEGGVVVAQDTDEFAVGLDISAIVANLAFGNLRKYDMFSRQGIVVAAQLRGGTWPIGNSINGVIAYLVE